MQVGEGRLRLRQAPEVGPEQDQQVLRERAHLGRDGRPVRDLRAGRDRARIEAADVADRLDQHLGHAEGRGRQQRQGRGVGRGQRAVAGELRRVAGQPAVPAASARACARDPADAGRDQHRRRRRAADHRQRDRAAQRRHQVVELGPHQEHEDQRQGGGRRPPAAGGHPLHDQQRDQHRDADRGVVGPAQQHRGALPGAGRDHDPGRDQPPRPGLAAAAAAGRRPRRPPAAPRTAPGARTRGPTPRGSRRSAARRRPRRGRRPGSRTCRTTRRP